MIFPNPRRSGTKRDEAIREISRAEAQGELSYGDARLFCHTLAEIRELPEVSMNRGGEGGD